MGTAGQSVTLANSIIGVGILAMPFCFQQCGVLLATVILLSMGLVSRLCCYFLLKSALLARRRNFEFLAFHVFGPAGKLAVEIGIIGFLMGTCIAYFVVVGDLGPQIIAKLLNINQSDILRTSIMVLVSLVCVLPLGLLRNVDSLSNVSAATIGFYFCLVIKVIAEAASQLLSGEWHTHLEMWKPSGVLQCVPIFSMALFCQTQLFEIFESLPTLSLEKMNVVTKNAINICTGVYFTLGVFGYIAFCKQQISGNILMSLSPTMASDVIKLGFVMSLAFSFPLIIFPCRASLYSLLYKKVHSTHHDHLINHSIPESSFRRLTVGIIAAALGVSLLVPNIELVLGLVGATIGVLVCLVFPAACFVNLTFKNTNERVLAKAVIVLGVIILILGTYANLQAAESQKDKYDDRYITQERIDKMVEDFFQKKDKPEGVLAKPMADTQSHEMKISDDVIKESEVQPPNPVPPESQSNEQVQNKIEDKPQPKHVEVPAKDMLDKASESHPKNLNKFSETKISNGETNIEKNKIEKTNEDKAKATSNEEKINIIKQQKLIETIKQHGEEQKELIKEQKEILDEILKTKKELQEQNKNEVDSIEAKKIAVESIKKIADMAIQSLGGVSDKPVQVEDKKPENIDKLADQAVKEIAKKAVETIEAIKVINEKVDPQVGNPQPAVQNVPKAPSQPANSPVAQNIQVKPNPLPNVNNVVPLVPNLNQAQQVAQNTGNQPIANNAQPVNNGQPVVQMPAANVQQAPVNAQQPSANVQPLQANVQQSPTNVNAQQPPLAVNNQQPLENIQLANQNVQRPSNAKQPSVNVQQPSANVQQPAIVQQPAVNVQQQPAIIQQPSVNVQQQLPIVQQPAVNVQPPSVNVQEPVNVPQPANVQQQSGNIQQLSVAQQQKDNIQQQSGQIQQQTDNVQQQSVNVQQPSKQQPANVQPSPNQNANVAQLISNNLPNQPAQSNVNQQSLKENVEKAALKVHSHSPDEPQSYKQGEDLQKKPESVHVNEVIQNPSLALPKDNFNQPQNIPSIQEDKPANVNNLNVPNVAIDNGKKNPDVAPARQKREVVDCTEKSALKPEDKQICENLINVPQQTKDVKVDFPKVDLIDVALPKSLPLDANLIYNIGRSLKSYDLENKKR